MGRSPDRHQRLRAIFDEAVQQEASALDAYLDCACADDPELRSDLQRLLGAFRDAGSFLERPPQHAAGTALALENRFPETDRFRIRRRLGAGGMGVVFEADDGVRGEIVALKRLRRSSAFDLYQFKREFRSLADVVHRNLVCLYELFVEETCAFFTMELVDGMGFVEHVRGAGRPEERGQRLTNASRQLVAGVSFLHDRGKLHRDIKPSNVLVTPTGRVVILDFGLVADRLPASVADAGYMAGGTPAYMSPEEAAGAPPSEAGDWYAVGVTLYESLTGRLPFSGSPREVLLRKQAADPPPPERLEPAAPSGLSELCMGLLRRDPAKRLNGHAALAALERRVVARPADRAMPGSREPTFVGRTQELESLEAALADVLAGVSSVVCLHGPSGIGKSALIERFFGQVATRGDVVVLAGRCYENESVPYKALDGVVDALARHLRSHTSDELAPLLPPDLPVLLQIFPVLGRVAAIADASDGRPIGGRDPVNLRLDAFAALRELLRRLARRQPLLVVIDDLQWADADSAVLLEHLFPAADAPVMLTVLVFRSEEIGAQPFLRSLLERAHRRPWSTLPVGPMTAADTDALMRALVAGTDVAETQRTQFAREAEGSPFVLEQLAWYRGKAGPSRDAPSLAEMLDGRLKSLTPSARRFLETLAMCGRPTPPELVCDACGVDHDRQSLVVTLRALRLVRSSGSLARVEPYHDRIREALTACMAPEAARSTHRGIAQALVARGVDDCDALFEHYRGAGDEENAALQAARAAEKAVRGLAFDRAASLYRHALARPPDQQSRQAWREGLAGALVNAGRPEEAAEAYLDAAAEAHHARQVELRRRAAEQFLVGGHIDRGSRLLQQALESVGLRAPRHSRGALWSLLWRRAHLRWRGLGFEIRQAGDIDPEALLRIDTCWSATSGLALVDMIRSSDFSIRHLHLALDAGDPWRVARAMAFESAARGAYPTGRRLTARLVARSRSLAVDTGHPHALALSLLADGIVATTRGEWRNALQQSEHALEILQDRCVGLTWETNTAQNLVIWALMYLGELGEVSRRVPALLADARRRGNLYLATELTTRCNYVWLIADDPDGGEREAMASIACWSQRGFHRQHYSALLARVQTALYRGDAAAAWRLLDDSAGTLRRSSLTWVQVIRIESCYLRGRAGLAMAATGHDSGRFIASARREAGRIARERMPWSDPLARLIEAGCASLDGRTSAARTHLRDAADAFDRADMRLYAAVARWRLGQLEGGTLRAEAEAWMTAQTIRNPARLTAMLAPGFADG